ncbi:MAG: beta-lactamase family protein [Bacteroidales bacterium]|nr:beta-lactamase family protein [Bacteroidales bacterium]MCF8333018.1 beta-lactamase family protein [Bacteroidales bacterium]
MDKQKKISGIPAAYTASLLVVLLISCSLPVKSQAYSAAIDSVLRQQHQHNQFNGVALVSKDGEIVYEKGWGNANESWDIPNTKHTKFRIGSCTKPLTATVVMSLAEQGKLDLNDSIARYLPEYPREKAEKITIRHLLEHSSGIPDYTGLDFFAKRMHLKNKPSEFVRNFWTKDLRFEPGTLLKYTNSGYYLLGVIIEQITGKPYENVLREHILSPAGMNNSGLYKNDTIIKKSATGYTHDNEQLKKAPHVNYSVAFSSCGIYSTAHDLYKWQQALHNNRLISEKSKQKMLQARHKHYGLGFTTKKDTLSNGKVLNIYGHEGGIFGFRSLIQMFKGENHFIVLLDNHDHNNLQAIAQEIRHLLFSQRL